MSNETVRNKNLYKIFISLLKFIPMILALVQIIGLTLTYCGISSMLLSCFGGSSIIFIGMLFMMSYIFKFCYLYRIPLWYITVIIILNILRLTGLIPIDLIMFYRILALISGIFISLFIIYMYKNRNKPKVDHIKQLCENYAECNCK